jgi:hypothetical protein
MSIIKFPTTLISTLELSEALDWNHADLMKDACSVAQVAEMPPEWFRPATYRDEDGAIQNSYNMTSSFQRFNDTALELQRSARTPT